MYSISACVTGSDEGKSRDVSGSRFRGFWAYRLVLFATATVASPCGLFPVASIKLCTVERGISWIWDR